MSDLEQEIERVDSRIDKLSKRVKRLERGQPDAEAPSTIRLVGAVATLITAFAAFLTPILVVILQ